ncbi:hypothetical protein [Telluribacter sp. SYSU D00476]|uniref:hypothetical protein n=1 Tax=Telluribacter sp. SYSU D00476 TaxID=2811430 RepID=UPI001FF68488|nr:hypothetical protein [Telluribacter sp. SYSU D00476]
MPITHRFNPELNALENNHTFFGHPVHPQSRFLFIGTFNPSDDSCLEPNTSEWFYGRVKNKFWKYMPTALTGVSLHPADGHLGYPQTWKDYCVDQRIVIIDLIKTIETDDVLPNFSDRVVDSKIADDLGNTVYFDIRAAFAGITFEKVIYSLRWTDNMLQRLPQVRGIVNEALLDTGCIHNINQIRYCTTPSRNDAFNSWDLAINH